MCYNGKSVEYVIINCSGIQLYDGTRPLARTECDTIALGVRLLSPQPTGDLLVPCSALLVT